eukprot:5856882-Prymnesium_polylepis.1
MDEATASVRIPWSHSPCMLGLPRRLRKMPRALRKRRKRRTTSHSTDAAPPPGRACTPRTYTSPRLMRVASGARCMGPLAAGCPSPGRAR